jgi:glutamate 5-kinase
VTSAQAHTAMRKTAAIIGASYGIGGMRAKLHAAFTAAIRCDLL